MYEQFYTFEVPHGIFGAVGADSAARCLRLDAKHHGEDEVLIIEMTGSINVAGFSKKGEVYTPHGIPSRIIANIPLMVDTVFQQEDLLQFREPLIEYYRRNVN